MEAGRLQAPVLFFVVILVPDFLALALKICANQCKSAAEKGFPLRSSAFLCGSRFWF
jgi:hypothetical protein